MHETRLIKNTAELLRCFCIPEILHSSFVATLAHPRHHFQADQNHEDWPDDVCRRQGEHVRVRKEERKTDQKDENPLEAFAFVAAAGALIGIGSFHRIFAVVIF
jgi:hypothetical protein